MAFPAEKNLPSISAYAEYAQLEGRWEVYGGKPSMMASPSIEHQTMLGELFMAFRQGMAGCTDCKAIMAPIEWQSEPNTIVQPDLLVVCGPVSGRPLHKTPALVLEVLSPSTAMHDLNTKFVFYQKNKVPYCLIADPVSFYLELFYLENISYKKIFWEAGEPIAHTFAFEGCTATIDFGPVFTAFSQENHFSYNA